jgi:hypothetical protein
MKSSNSKKKAENEVENNNDIKNWKRKQKSPL